MGLNLTYRRLAQAAEWALAIIVVALHGLVFVLAPRHPDVAWLQLAGDAQPIALAAAALGWALFGPGWLWVRAVAVPIFAVIWVLAIQAGDRRYFNPADSEIPFPFAVAVAIGLLLAVSRLAGLKLQSVPAGKPEPRPQFSILALLATTTLIALAIGGLELLRPTILIVDRNASYEDFARLIVASIEAENTSGRLEIIRGLVPGPASVRQGVLSLAIAAAAAGGMAIVLRPRLIWMRLAIAAVALPMLGVYLTHLASAPRDEFAARATELTAAFTAVSALSALSVWPLRLLGYRVLRPAPSDSAAHAERASQNCVSLPINSNRDGRTALTAETVT
jgi:hypothetical protein